MTTQNLGSFDDWGRRPNQDEQGRVDAPEPAWWTDGSNRPADPQTFPAADAGEQQGHDEQRNRDEPRNREDQRSWDEPHTWDEPRNRDEPRNEQGGRGWTAPNETVDGAPSGGWGTPGDHLTGPLPRLRPTPTPYLASEEQGGGPGRGGGSTAVGAPQQPRGFDGPAPGYPGAPPSGPMAPGSPAGRGGSPDQARAPWGPPPPAQQPGMAPGGWGGPPSANSWEQPPPNWPGAAGAPRTGTNGEAGFGAIFDFGFRRRAVHRLTPVIYTLVFATAVIGYAFAITDAVLRLDETDGTFLLIGTVVVGLLIVLAVTGAARVLLEVCRNLDRLAHERSGDGASGGAPRA